MRRSVTHVFMGFCCLLLANGARGDVYVNFNSGPGAYFTTFATPDAGLWTIATGGPQLAISKPADDGSVVGDNFVVAGYDSVFSLRGDFTATIDFGLPTFPATGYGQLNESVFAVQNGDSIFGALRFRSGSDDLVEVWDGVAARGVASSSLTAGQYRIARVGNQITASIGSGGFFTDIYSGTGFTADAQLHLAAQQGINPRATTALDITFDNLTISADEIVGIAAPVPVPAAALLATLGLAVAGGKLRRDRTPVDSAGPRS